MPQNTETPLEVVTPEKLASYHDELMKKVIDPISAPYIDETEECLVFPSTSSVYIDETEECLVIN